jgi:energy-coupling factor transporter ATP-binding protein EcfA2
MRLIKFKAQNFRSVVDSGWIDAEQVTALIGVNESGKTNLLLPLWKLNPAREGEIRPTSDYPKGNYAAVREKPEEFWFIHAYFDVDELADQIADLTGLDRTLINVAHVAKNFAGEFFVDFPNYRPPTTATAADLTAQIDRASSEISAMSPLAKESSLKDDMLASFKEANRSLSADEKHDADVIANLIAKLKEEVPEAVALTSSIGPRFALLLETLGSIEARLRAPAPAEVAGVRDLILKALPRFVYYSNYGNLDSEIYLPHVVENLKRNDLGAREAAKARTLRVLFSFVRLKPEEILELGRDFEAPDNRTPTPEEITAIATKKRERTILLNSAGTDLTKRFRDWWKQGDYTFEFQADGDHFRIWVSDRRRPEKVELEDRSSGLQWFLSFYLIFLVESSRDHRNAILLLDEPGLSLHPLAQRDLSAFFENLAGTNQIIYTTHSPFLVDADMLDRVRKVYVGDDGSTLASADLRIGSDDPRKSGATYAIYSALNMNVAESILYNCQPVIVEGPSDQHYLATIKVLLIASKRISPKREIVFPPSHGANNAKVVASILSGKDEVLPSMLLDGDTAGKKMARDLQNGLYQSDKGKIKTTDAYAGFENSEIEDLFPTAFIANVVDRWGRHADTPFSDVAVPRQPIVPQIEDWAKSESIELYDGWKVDIAREAKRRALAPSHSFEPSVIEKWGKMFDDLLS